MDAYSQLQGQGQEQEQGQGRRLGDLGPQQPQQQQQQQHTSRHRHVSAPVQQSQNLSSFQEGMRQDSVVVNAAAALNVPMEGSKGPEYDQDSLLQSHPLSNLPIQQQYQQHHPLMHSDRSTGHVGIMIDDHQGQDHKQSHGGNDHAQGDASLMFEQGHTPSGSPLTGHRSQVQPELLPSSAVDHSSRGSQNPGVFQQGYSQYHGQLPGATLSRHLSIQLSPNATLLPPPPPALQSGSHALQSPYLMDGSQGDSSPQGREYVMPPSNTTSNQSMGSAGSAGRGLFQSSSQQIQPQQHLYQQQRQPQSPSQQSVAVPPPPVKYIRSPMRSPNMPQMSSQAMAHAQAQAQAQAQVQSQYRHHGSHQHRSPMAHSQQHFPPRTHRRSIQPLTLDQQQPKGGSFRYVRNQADLWPQKGSQKYRSIDAYGHSISPLRALTELLTKTYSHCNRDFKYEPSYNPRRVLTKPSKPMHNEGYDNEDYDYILYVSDILGSEERQRYIILDVLGQGTFGQVVKCQNLKTNEIVAVKVIKNKPAYFNQSMMEVTVLELLNERYDVDDRHHILRLRDTFIHRRHLCLAFELLSVNLYELIKQNQFRGLSMSLVRVFTAQLLDALCVLNEARIIHCDLKPENVLLKNLETPTIKVIDFGSACHEQQTVYTYIQSRFYRSPEVLVGLPYSSSIDIWSVGCIAAELFLGLPLFPGSSEYNQLSRIVEMLGMLPTYMLDIGKTAHEFFEVVRPEHLGHNYSRPPPKRYRLKSMETYSREHGVIEQPSKRYFQATTLPDIINSYPMLKKGMTPKEIEKETMNRQSFINFLQGLLNLNPIERWSPHQAKLHPFITGEPFTGTFIPPTIPKKPSTAENSARLEPTLPGRTNKTRSTSLSASSSAPAFTPSSIANDKPAGPRQNSKADPPSGSSSLIPMAIQQQDSKDDADLIGAPGRLLLSALGGSAAPSSENSGDSSVTDVSSLNASPAAPAINATGTLAATVGAAGSSGVAFASDTSARGLSEAQTNTIQPQSGPHHHHHHHQQRPRATTMGTVEVPKNMAQLAAAMTPQQGQGSGISGTSSLSHRVGPNDPAIGVFESSSPFSASLGTLGGGYGLRQIPERSEQNSPVLDGLTSAGSGESSRSSSSGPVQQSLQESRPAQQHLQQTRQYQQQPRRHLHRSGSDAGVKLGAARSLRGMVEGTNSNGSRRTSGYLQGGNFAGQTSHNVFGTTTSSQELTPLERMQQQLIQSQSQQQRQQQQRQPPHRHRYHFGYPQSGSSPSENSASSAVDSNRSSCQGFLSEPEFNGEGGSLRQMDLDSRHGGSSGSPMTSEGDDDAEVVDGQFLRAGNDGNNSLSPGGIRGSSASGTSSGVYSRSHSSTSVHSRSEDGAESPNVESLEENAILAGTAPLVSPPIAVDMAIAPTEVEQVLSNVEECEEEEGGEEEETSHALGGDMEYVEEQGRAGVDTGIEKAMHAEKSNARQGERQLPAEDEGSTNVIQQNTKPPHGHEEEEEHKAP
ncbi:hypothetical protein BC939DRAFT_149344 [Gamsiella multidivaricata]|uniref:uncharacterized protein n=1 Tax=Gamsiella multidivaricata TaxID=101098 RepID=UPI00221E9940|nr:uncharacterized protein BC939DRAFT_149344 [Gamsiella multidivaricata]KAI7831761.1 hypothetical protein BC939DRAFT_149344 [Gamsiella multidivaricata]